MENKEYPTVRRFMLKKFPPNKYIDCPVPKHHWEVIQEYANLYTQEQTKELKAELKIEVSIAKEMDIKIKRLESQLETAKKALEEANLIIASQGNN